MKNLPALLCLLAASIPAQPARYLPNALGAGCRGTGTNSCRGINERGGTLLGSPLRARHAIELSADANLPITGVELFTRSLAGTVRVPVSIWIPGPGPGSPPLRAVGSGTMTIGTSARFYRASITPTVRFSARVTLFIVFGADSRIVEPVLTSGRSWSSFRQLALGEWVRSPQRAWSWKIGCGPSTGGVPRLDNVNLPALGSLLILSLTEAPPDSPATLLFGVSRNWLGSLRLPFDLRDLGATGCLLRCSNEHQLPFRTNGLGQAQFAARIPNDPRLLNRAFHNQWIVHDRAANALGITVSNGGTGLIGR